MATSKKKKSQQAKARSQGRQQAEKRKVQGGNDDAVRTQPNRTAKPATRSEVTTPTTTKATSGTSGSKGLAAAGTGDADAAASATDGVAARASAGLLAVRNKVNATLLGTGAKPEDADADAVTPARTSGRTTPRARSAGSGRVGAADGTDAPMPAAPRVKTTFALDPPQGAALNWLMLVGVSLAVVVLSVASLVFA